MGAKITMDPELQDADRLIAAAEEATGLDNWGDPDWREGFDVLLDALRGEAGLNDMGRVVFSHRLGGYLRQRLAVIDWHRCHPDIAATPVDGPLIIVGLPRTGTTALSNLLAADAATRSLRVWESAEPTPPPQAARYDRDPRIATMQAQLDTMDQLLPAMKTMHDDTATSTAENIDLLGMSFRTHHFDGMAHVPSYNAWWEQCDMEGAYAFHRQVLELLGWRCPPHRWHLKNPPDLFFLDTVASVYPDARFIWTHRSPCAVLPSVCNLIATVQGLVSDRVDRAAMGPRYTALWARAVARGMALRRTLGEERFIDVYHADLVADPVATVAGVYEAAGWRFDTQAQTAIAAWAAANRPGRQGVHAPDPDDFGLDRAAVNEHFAPYLERFGLTAGTA